jgi:sugar phosphate isomerase/epimerase
LYIDYWILGKEDRLKAGIATIALRNYDIFTALDMAGQAGFAGVEIWGKPPHTPEGVDEDYTRRIRDRSRANGLEIPIFGSYVNPSWPEFARKSGDAIKIATRLGAKIIRVWAGNKEPHDADEELWGHVASSLREFALRAEFEGLRLAIEMHGDTLCHTPEGARRLLEMADAPNLRLNYQVGDFANPDVEHDLAMVGDKVVMVHAQNFKRSCSEPGKMNRTLVQGGTVDYDKALSLLAAHGFKGYVEVEFLNGENVSEDALLESLKKDAECLTTLTARYSA